MDLVSRASAIPPQPGGDSINSFSPLGVAWSTKNLLFSGTIAVDTTQSDIILGAGDYNSEASPTYVSNTSSVVETRDVFDAYYAQYQISAKRGWESLEFGDRNVYGVEILLNSDPLWVSLSTSLRLPS